MLSKSNKITYQVQSSEYQVQSSECRVRQTHNII